MVAVVVEGLNGLTMNALLQKSLMYIVKVIRLNGI